MTTKHTAGNTESEMIKESHKIEMHTPDPGYEAFPVSIMNRSTHEVMTFDPAAGKPAKISYSLNKAGCIRIRLVERRLQNMVIRTLQDWTEQPFGKYELQWDGRDNSGNTVDSKRIFVLFESKDREPGRRHQNHDKKECRDLSVLLEDAPDPGRIVSGEFKIKAALPEQPMAFAQQNGFEARWYLDYKSIQTEKIAAGTLKFVSTIDTTAFHNGQHLLILNIDDLHGHIGSAGLTLIVGN